MQVMGVGRVVDGIIQAFNDLRVLFITLEKCNYYISLADIIILKYM